jgi:hypothetical protein
VASYLAFFEADGMSPELKKIYKRRLRCLEEKRAYYGIDTPTHIIMEIEDIRDIFKKKLPR